MERQIPVTTLTEVDNTDRIMHLETVSKESIPFSNAVKILGQREAAIEKVKKDISDLEDSIEKKFWEKELENLKLNLERETAVANVLREGLRNHFEELEKKGFEELARIKAEEGFDAMEESDKKSVKRVEILNRVRESIGIDDIAHPVVQKIRKDFDAPPVGSVKEEPAAEQEAQPAEESQ